MRSKTPTVDDWLSALRQAESESDCGPAGFTRADVEQSLGVCRARAGELIRRARIAGKVLFVGRRKEEAPAAVRGGICLTIVIRSDKLQPWQ